MVSLTEAAKIQGSATGSLEEVKTQCQCMGVCFQDGRCKCWSKGLKCTYHCHGKLTTGDRRAKKGKKMH